MTTTTEVELYETEAEVSVREPLSEKAAKALDKKIRTASDRLSTTTENLLNLLEEAAAGAIHEALGLPSWTAWFKDAVQINVSDRFERKELVKMMSGKGMSQRAIAGSLGVSQKTVDRDLEGEEVEEGATVTSLDGAERPKNGKASHPAAENAEAEPDSEYIDAEVVEPPTPAAEIVESFNDETINLWGAWSELKDLMTEEKWAGARKRIANANLNHIQDVIAGLQTIVDDLMVGTGK
jgi:transcriptional regulator with XRE-family HTH domain